MPETLPVVPITLHADFNALLVQYRRALEIEDGIEFIREQSDAELISIAARCYMTIVVRRQRSDEPHAPVTGKAA